MTAPEFHTAARPRRRWFQYSLRTLMLAMVLSSIGMSWLALRMQMVRGQKEAVEAIIKSGGAVDYDYQVFPSQSSGPPGPAWLQSLLGEDSFARVVRTDNAS